MYDIPTREWTREFVECWRAAGLHLQEQARRSSVDIVWLKANLEQPSLEHLSFRVGNQLFFVRLEGVDGPGNLDGLRSIADGCRGHACVMPMRKTETGWTSASPGWGLIDPDVEDPESVSRRMGAWGHGVKVVNPPSLVTGEVVEMTDWELHDFGVQVVRQHLEQQGRRIMSSQGNPSVDPSIWFVGDKGPEWVVVRAVRYPLKAAAPPGNWAAIAAGCSRLSANGHFASVAVASADDSSDKSMLRRGGPMRVSYKGLTQIS